MCSSNETRSPKAKMGQMNTKLERKVRGDKESKYACLAEDDDAGKVQLDVRLPEQAGQHSHKVRKTQLCSNDFLHLAKQTIGGNTVLNSVIDGEGKARRN